MRLSDISVQRPVLAMVIAALIIAFGLLALNRLPLQEYPTIDPPVVTIDTRYPGASASVVETRITQVLEDRIAGVEGIELITSQSEDGRSQIEIEFGIDMDINAAANDIRDRISGALRNLPDDADNPEVTKADSSEEVVVWLSLSGNDYSITELTDYANRFLVDSLSVQPGVARVRVGGGSDYAMRVWLDRNALAARGLTVSDIEDALRAENVELPAGSLESKDRQFIVRLPRSFASAEDFQRLALSSPQNQEENGYLVRLADVARVEVGAVEDRSVFRSNGIPMVGLGMIMQSTANVIELSEAVQVELERLQGTLPEGMSLSLNYDASLFVSGAIEQVVMTLFIAMGLVVVVIFMFLGNLRTTLVPAVTVPIAVIGAFTALAAMNFSINLLTLLALVLAIGLIVDDAIVVLENINRRMHDYGETPLVAAFRGTRQIAFAVIATTLVLVAVFLPLSMLQGDIGRLFSEFALTMAAAVVVSTLLALTLTPMMASKILKPGMHESRIGKAVQWLLSGTQRRYQATLEWMLKMRWLVVAAFVLLIGATAWLATVLPNEYTPQEDRGNFIVLVNGPEGATFDYMMDYMDEIEARMTPLVESGELERVVVRAPRGYGNIENFNSGFIIVNMADWGSRRSAWEIMGEVREKLRTLPGVQAFPVMRQGFGQRTQKPVQFVLGGGTYEELARWRDTLIDHVRENNPRLMALESNYNETQPQLRVDIDYERAASLGVTVTEIGRTLEVLLGGRNVTRYVDDGEEYDVILEGDRGSQNSPRALDNIQVRSARTGELIPLASLVTLSDFAGASTLNRFDRIRAITIEANLADSYPLGEALTYLEQSAAELLPEEAQTNVAGASRDFQQASGATAFLLILGALVVFLVLAAQFESLIHPFVIMLTVPLAMSGALLALLLSGQSLNIYSQVGLVLLIGLAAKNGILIVEFANQLRDEGKAFRAALIEASVTRLRPILMTAVTTMAGAIPLIVSTGPGSESRLVIGTVIMAGLGSATLFTLFVVPVAYDLLARHTGSPGAVKRRLEEEIANAPSD
ncbi:efflux RND transporter permease subunit [Vreelandella titanicae]|uniref:efflux RND transporter permease subunit n=1 Tax=Halomonadaceae TaxID=28256 RepID=UPI0004854F11|nr:MULTISPECIES: efflux RND transporter permease subunit [unclassified Halomonas]KIN13420.1 multidrug transporter AcrB [Halomonas sp. KHS3]NAO98422.1 MMPL family transporter [Halomonas sp. MG34]PKH60162.1 AcrB/AcrD/AcrF family protein [Halomonas sp. Choline-3u-9]UEQ02528.1 efflux RND transporter permease subunit [Halomonas profundus]